MTTGPARALLRRLGLFLDGFSACFSRQPQREAATQYIDGLCNDSERKSMQVMHGRLGDPRDYPGHAMTEILQRALDARVAPAWVVGRHSHHEATNLRKRVGPSEAAPRIRPFPGDQLAVPAQNGVSRDDRRHLCQQPTTESRATSSQAPSVAVGEPQTLILQVRLQHAVLFAQVLDGLMLVALEPTDESGDEQLQWNHAPSLRHLGRNFRTLRDALQTEVDELKRLQAESAAEFDVLLPSILERAFRGEL